MVQIENENPYLGEIENHIKEGVILGSDYPPIEENGLVFVLQALVSIGRADLDEEQASRFEVIRRTITDRLYDIDIRKNPLDLFIELEG